MSKPWIFKHIPQNSSSVVGQEKAVALCKLRVEGWSRKSKPLVLWGPTGTGKTATAIALSKELGLELVEVNASDSRNKDAIEQLIGGAVKQGSLFGTSKLILVDEVEGLSGRKDRGAIPTLLKVIKNSMYPIILTLEDPFDSKFKALRKACELIEYTLLDTESVSQRVTTVLEKESITFAPEDVTKLSRSAGGDMRAAINDAQNMSYSGALVIEQELLGERERKESMQQALMRVLKTTNAKMARGAFDHVVEDINQIMLWMDENVAIEYKNVEDIYRAYDALGEADKFLGRIRRWQHYRFYVYAYDLVSSGVACAKDQKYPGVREYKQSSRLLSIWMANQKNAKKKIIAEKIAAVGHCSVKDAREQVPFLQQIFINNPTEAEKLATAYDLGAEEVAWLKK